jgi:hypothetical protein
MSKIYAGQDLKLTLTGYADITGGSAKIQYMKPGSSVINEKTPIIPTPTIATCFYNFTPTDLDTPGQWTFWLKLTFADSKIGYGEPFKFTIHGLGG